MRLTPPTNLVFLISVLLAIAALAVHLIPQISSAVPLSGFWIGIGAYVLLALGNVLKGF